MIDDHYPTVMSGRTYTAIYIFDAQFGEEMPTMLDDYNVNDLKVFQEDFLSVLAGSKQDNNGKKWLTTGVQLEAIDIKIRKHKTKSVDQDVPDPISAGSS